MTQKSFFRFRRSAAPSRHPLPRLISGVVLALAVSSAAPRVEPSQAVRWQPVTMTFDGPQASEAGTPNPFRDYRMSVQFRHEASGYESSPLKRCAGRR